MIELIIAGFCALPLAVLVRVLKTSDVNTAERLFGGVIGVWLIYVMSVFALMGLGLT